MAATDLVTLSELKTWLNITTTDANRDAMLSRLITQISRAIINDIARPILLPKTTTEVFDGNGHTRMVLSNWPVHSVTSLKIDDVVIPQSTDVTLPGYVLELPEVEPPGTPQQLILRCRRFERGKQNVSVTYVCGYMVTNEQTTIGTGTYTAVAPFGEWASDYSVVYANGTALVPVAANPAVGQYSVAGGVYTFAAGDAGQVVSISYGYIPADLTQCAIEWIAARYAARDRVGVASKSLGGQETVSFLNEAIPKFVDSTLQPFRRVTP